MILPEEVICFDEWQRVFSSILAQIYSRGIIASRTPPAAARSHLEAGGGEG